MKNKKAWADSLIVWVVASLLIAFILFVYFIILAAMDTEKRYIGGYGEVEVKTGGFANEQATLESLFAFLNSETEIVINNKREKLLVKDLIFGEPKDEGGKEKFDKFKELAEQFMDENVMKKDEDKYKYSCLEILDFNNRGSESGWNIDSLYDKYQAYLVYRGRDFDFIRTNARPCRDSNSESYFTSVYVLENKKVELCIELGDKEDA